MDDIKVTITKRPDRKFYTMRYRCPMTGQMVAKSSKAETEKAAIAVKERACSLNCLKSG